MNTEGQILTKGAEEKDPGLLLRLRPRHFSLQRYLKNILKTI